MTDRYDALLVTFDEPPTPESLERFYYLFNVLHVSVADKVVAIVLKELMRDDDAKSLLSLIGDIKGVTNVEASIFNTSSATVTLIKSYELYVKIREVTGEAMPEFSGELTGDYIGSVKACMNVNTSLSEQFERLRAGE